MDHFIPWAVLDMWVGRLGYSCGPFWILPWTVLDISKIYGPFWSGPFWFMGRFSIDPCSTGRQMTERQGIPSSLYGLETHPECL